MRFRPTMPKRLWGAVLIAASVSACAPPKDEERAAPQPAPAAVAASPLPSPSPAYEAPGMTPEQVQARIQAGEKVAIVDVRSKTSYQHAHIKGALSIPWRDLEKGYKQLPKDYLIALYCT